jgi:hypothetical protein
VDAYSAPSEPLLDSFERYLRAANRADSTIASYLEGVRQAVAFLDRQRVPLVDATRADLEAFLADLLTRESPSRAVHPAGHPRRPPRGRRGEDRPPPCRRSPDRSDPWRSRIDRLTGFAGYLTCVGLVLQTVGGRVSAAIGGSVAGVRVG